MVKTSGMTSTVHDPEVKCSNPGWVELGVHSTSVEVRLELKLLTDGVNPRDCTRQRLYQN